VITLFTTAKPFIGKMRVNQQNAIRSWKMLDPDIDVILFGSGDGYGEIAQALGINHVPGVETSEYGTPLFNSMVELARERGRYPIQVYINCDIVLTKDFLTAVQCVKHSRFLMVGRRWDLDLNQEINFQKQDWEQDLKMQLAQKGALHPPTGSDYFAYRGDIWNGLPKLIVGRAGYDNYLIYHCLKSGIPVIDASQVVSVIHQNHDYAHHTGGVEGVWKGDEAQVNYQAGRKLDYIFTLVDADWILSPQGEIRQNNRRDLDHLLGSWYALAPNPLWKKVLGLAIRLIRLLKKFNLTVL
jgi:hypothetical protein